MRSLVIALMATLGVMATAWAAEEAAPPPPPAPVMCDINAACAGAAATLSGKLRVVGSGQFPVIVLSTADGKDVALDGALLGELRSLQRLGLQVKGSLLPKNGLYERFLVTSYEITDVGGAKPHVGAIEAAPEGKVLLREGEMALELAGNTKVLAKLKAAAGAKAWIDGEVKDGVLRVKRYGVIGGAGK